MLSAVQSPAMLNNNPAKQEDSYLSDTKSVPPSSDTDVQHESEPGWSPPTFSNSEFTRMNVELDYYKKRCEEAEENLKRETDQRRLFESTSQAPGHDKKKLFQQEIQIRNLQTRLEIRTDLQHHLSIGTIQSTASGSRQVLTKFEALKEELLSLLVRDGAYKLSARRLKGRSHDLDDLLINVFGNDSLCRTQELPEAVTTLTTVELVRSLVGAAMKSWVFESEYQTYTFAPTPLLRGYRNFIATMCMYVQ